MNKKILAALAATAAMAGVSQPAFATSSGTITINGSVVESTCDVLVNGSQNPTVVLPNVATGDLAAAGATAAWTPISFVLSGCTAVTVPAAATNVVPYLQTAAGGTIDLVTGNLRNLAATTPAANVQVALSSAGSAGTKLTLNGAAGAQGIAPAAIASNPTFNIYAGYIATGVAGAGGVQAQVAYNLAYL